jgi:predicted outer membrane protein
METEMKLTIIATLIMGLAVAGCGGGSDNNSGTTSAATPAATGSSGASGTTGTTGAAGTGAVADATPVSSGGTQFLNQTAQSGQAQAQESTTAAQKSSNPEVKALAQQTTNEINIINQQITQISQVSNVTINNNVTTQQQTQINNLNTLSGTELDRTYVSDLVANWKALLATTLAQTRQGTDVKVRHAASANVLLIKQRLTIAQELLCILQPTAYLVDAYQDGLLEIQLAKVALQKATNAQVKQFAQHMIDEHTQLNANITTLAKQKSVTLPTTLSADQQEILTLISSFTAEDFDKAYMDRNVLIHTEDVSKTTIVAQRNTDADVKALAAQGLPRLQEHLQTAQSIATSLRGTQLYQLCQTLVSETQVAQLVQARTTNAQVKARAQQIITENQTCFVQLVQLATQRNQPIPVTVPPEQAPAAMQLSRATGAEADAQALALLIAQNSQSVQVVQSAQASTETGVTAFATTRVSILQARTAALAQLSSGSAAGSAGSTTTPATTATTTPAATTGTGTGTTGTGATGTGTPTTGTSSSGTTASGQTTAGTGTTTEAASTPGTAGATTGTGNSAV